MMDYAKLIELAHLAIKSTSVIIRHPHIHWSSLITRASMNFLITANDGLNFPVIFINLLTTYKNQRELHRKIAHKIHQALIKFQSVKAHTFPIKCQTIRVYQMPPWNASNKDVPKTRPDRNQFADNIFFRSWLSDSFTKIGFK